MRCRRYDLCGSAAVEAHAPWCSPECEHVGRALDRLTPDKGDRLHPSPPVELAARFAWPWLDVRAGQVAQ